MGTIAQKLEYLATTKTKIKDSINLTGAGITTEPFRQYAVKLKDAYVDIINNGTETLYNNFPKVSATGESMELSNTYEAPMQSTLKGNTSQVQLSGKNLLDDTQWVQNRVINNTSGDITYSQNNASSEQYMAVQPNTTYTFSSALSCRALRVGTYKSDKTFIERKSSSANVSTWTFTTDANTYYLRWNINYNDTTITQDNIDALQLQINSGNERGTYEQYCGGTPSPNPSYPQDIHNVSGNNDILVCGKNLFDKSAITGGYINADGTISANDNYKTTDYIKIDGTLQYSKTATNSPRIKLYDENKELITTSSYSDISSFGNSGTYTIPYTNAKYIRFSIRVDSSGVDINDVMFVIGNTIPTTYEAYNGTTYPINLPSGMELCKIGDYQDSFIYDNDKWYLHKEIYKYVFDGTENWRTDSGKQGTDYRHNISISTTYLNVPRPINIDKTYISNYFSQQTITYDVGELGVFYCNNNWFVFPDKNKVYNLDGFKTWLGTHNTSVYYVLATPTNTEITDTTLLSQLEAIYNAKSRNGTTNINQENNDLGFIITASALEKEQ